MKLHFSFYSDVFLTTFISYHVTDIDFPEKSIQALQKKWATLNLFSLPHFRYLSFIKFERYEEASQRNWNSMENLDLEKKSEKIEQEI